MSPAKPPFIPPLSPNTSKFSCENCQSSESLAAFGRNAVRKRTPITIKTIPRTSDNILPQLEKAADISEIAYFPTPLISKSPPSMHSALSIYLEIFPHIMPGSANLMSKFDSTVKAPTPIRPGATIFRSASTRIMTIKAAATGRSSKTPFKRRLLLIPLFATSSFFAASYWITSKSILSFLFTVNIHFAKASVDLLPTFLSPSLERTSSNVSFRSEPPTSNSLIASSAPASNAFFLFCSFAC